MDKVNKIKRTTVIMKRINKTGYRELFVTRLLPSTLTTTLLVVFLIILCALRTGPQKYTLKEFSQSYFLGVGGSLSRK